MLPTPFEWKSWSALEKMTYVAQIAAALALLPTVVFSFLSLREARLARTEQVNLFMAEKLPEIEISDIWTSGNIVTLELHNAGESLATETTVAVMVAIDPPDRKAVAGQKQLDLKPVPNKFGSTPPSIAKGRKQEFPIFFTTELEKLVGFRPSAIKMGSFKDAQVMLPGQLQGPTLLIHIGYKDILGRDYMKMAYAHPIR